MARRKLSSFSSLWARHKQIYLSVFSMALMKLAEMDAISGNEDAISERLCIFLNNVCYTISKSRDQEIATPYWEGPISPVTEDELKGGKVRKRPDFTCKCLNPWADLPEHFEISLHVECKLLGNPTSASWVLNKNYVVDGIKRFDSKTHKYGKRASSGIMIGYIISMTPEKIETEVNKYQEELLPENPDLIFTVGSTPLNQAHQVINRRHIEPVHFELFHLWIDIRNCYH